MCLCFERRNAETIGVRHPPSNVALHTFKKSRHTTDKLTDTLPCLVANHQVDEGETEAYLAAYTKSCPQCAMPIGMHICTDRCPTPCTQKSRPALGGCNHFVSLLR